MRVETATGGGTAEDDDADVREAAVAPCSAAQGHKYVRRTECLQHAERAAAVDQHLCLQQELDVCDTTWTGWTE